MLIRWSLLRTARYALRFALLGMVFAAAPALAEQAFDNVAGSWSGVGSMKPSDGPRERVRCKVNYAVKSTGNSLKMDLLCASDAYKMHLSANIDQDGSTISGNWFEDQYRQGARSRVKTSTESLRRRPRATPSPRC